MGEIPSNGRGINPSKNSPMKTRFRFGKVLEFNRQTPSPDPGKIYDAAQRKPWPSALSGKRAGHYTGRLFGGKGWR
jgi:hypothetical protein